MRIVNALITWLFEGSRPEPGALVSKHGDCFYNRARFIRFGQSTREPIFRSLDAVLIRRPRPASRKGLSFVGGMPENQLPADPVPCALPP